MGNLAPPVLKAEMAVFLLTPHNSKIIEPPETLLAQKLTDPLPLPIRTSVGFLVTGIEGNTLIQSLPFRLIFRIIDCLAASICLAETVPDSADFNPIVPNFSLFDLKFKKLSLPFLTFLNFDFLGCKNMLL